MKITEYKAERDCFKRRRELNEECAKERAYCDKEYKKLQRACNMRVMSVFRPASEFYKSTRILVIAENSKAKNFLDELCYYYRLAKECEEKMVSHDNQAVRDLSTIAKKLQEEFETRFAEYHELCAQMRILENKYKVAVNEFLNFKVTKMSEDEAVKNMSKISDAIVKNLDFIWMSAIAKVDEIKIPAFQALHLARMYGVPTTEIDEEMKMSAKPVPTEKGEE